MVDLEDIRARAGEGDARAMFALGNVYHVGLHGQPVDLRAARTWYERAAEAGSTDACANLGMMKLEESRRTRSPRTAREAARWLRMAAERGDPECMVRYGQLLLDGEGVEADPEAALDHMQRASEAGNAMAHRVLGARLLEQGKDARAVEMFERGRAGGDAAATTNLAFCHEHGRGVPQDPVRAMALLGEAVAGGDGLAAYNAGVMTFNGRGCAPDPAAATRWFQQGAELGNSDAMYEFANSLRTGRGCAPDPERALTWYQSAGKAGHVEALFCAGLMLRDGLGTPDGPRPDLAEPWWQQASMQGHAGAMHNLGILFAQGQGVAPNLDLALHLCEQAAHRGCVEAMFSAGLTLLKCEPVDWVRAGMWALLSIQHDPQGNGRALAQRVQEHAAPEQLAEAERLAAEWRPAPAAMAFLTGPAAAR